MEWRRTEIGLNSFFQADLYRKVYARDCRKEEKPYRVRVARIATPPGMFTGTKAQ